MIKQLLKKVLIIYLVVIACVFTPTYNAYAASAGGWAFNSFNVATSVVTAIKGGASASVAVAKSPISAKIAKGIVGGVIAGAALPLAISQLSGFALEAIDWVLDPANNAVKWKPKAGTKVGYYKVDSVTAPTAQQACEKYINAVGGFGKVTSIVAKSDQFCVVYSNFYPDGGAAAMWQFVETGDYNWRSIPIPTVANKIFDNAKTDSDSRSVVNDAVKEYVNEGSADTALDNAKADADATHACGSGTHWSGSACVADTPTTPSTPTTDTPFDPTSIIDAINSVFNAISNLFDAVMSIPDVINTAIDDLLVDIKDFFQPVIDLVTDFFQWVKDTAIAWKDDFVDEYKAFRDWVKSEPTPENPTQPDVTTLPTPPTDSVNISFDGGCPAPKVVPWYLGGHNVEVTIPYTPICDTATLLNPLIKLAASLGAVFIIAGIRRGDDG